MEELESNASGVPSELKSRIFPSKVVVPAVEEKVGKGDDVGYAADEDAPAPGPRRVLLPTDSAVKERKSVHAPTDSGPYNPDIV